MLRISKKDEEIIFRDIALSDIISNVLIMSAAFFLLYFGIVDAKRSVFPFIVILICLMGAVYNLGFVQIKTIKINKQKRILSINNRSLVKNISHVYRFGEINDLVYVETLTIKKGMKSHKLVFPLETGERIELARSISSGEDEYLHAAIVVNNFIFNKTKKNP